MQVELIVSVKDDFIEDVGPSEVHSCFLSLDGMLFDIGRFYQGPKMNKETGERLKKVQAFGEMCKSISTDSQGVDKNLTEETK